jgi:hypothetical protein
MKVTYKSKSGRFSVELEGSQKEIFGEISDFQEVFENDKCEACGKSNIRFVVRTVEDNEYYEIHCLEKGCRAKLAFGQHKKSDTLFPKRKSESGYLDNQGWTKYVPESKSNEQS